MNTIKFQAMDEYSNEVALRPYPATQAIPEWWKAMTPYSKSPDNPEGKKLIVSNRVSNAGPKKCVPMLDAITSGYIIPLWADVQIKNDGPNKFITWRTAEPVFQEHGHQAREEVEVPVEIKIVKNFQGQLYPYKNFLLSFRNALITTYHKIKNI